ncbi:MAG: phosphoglucosamine mutase [Patescibacteria group bacterium]
MTLKPKLQVTGYRGIWGESLNEQIAFEYARSYAKMITSLPYSGGVRKVIVGRDARQTGPKIFESVREALEKENIEVVNAGIIPTPSILLLVNRLNLSGGIMITASHNPPEYNGVKFVAPGGRLTNESEVITIEKFRNNLSEEEKIPSLSEIKDEKIDNKEFRKIHINEILQNIDANLIRSKKFKVALDPINSAGSIITQELLRELNCQVYVINEEQNGNFTHPPEPLPQNLNEIAEAVSQSGSDIGFAQDPDADRLIVVDEKGVVISEEYTLALAIRNVSEHNPDSVVINLSTSKMSEDIARQYGREVIRTKVGEGNIVEKLVNVKGAIGGEGNGGVIYPKINTARDSLVGVGLILELMARENKTIGDIVASFPKYYMKKDKISVTEDLNLLYAKLKNNFSEAKTVELDGVYFNWPDSSWLHVRSSMTEPIIRIFGEAKTKDRINSLFEEVRLTLDSK